MLQSNDLRAHAWKGNEEAKWTCSTHLNGACFLSNLSSLILQWKHMHHVILCMKVKLGTLVPSYLGCSIPQAPGKSFATSDGTKSTKLTELPVSRFFSPWTTPDSFGISDRRCLAQLLRGNEGWIVVSMSGVSFVVYMHSFGNSLYACSTKWTWNFVSNVLDHFIVTDI